MQLIIVGMHRSGTSVLARLLNLMGVYFAPEGMGTGANQENPKGFWERRDVRALNDFVLHGSGCDWNRVAQFDVAKLPAPLLAEFDKRAGQIVLSMDAYRPWFIKEPRLCLLLPLWRRVLENPTCVHILRHPVEVASSLRTRNKIPMDAGLALWEAYNRSAIHGMEGLPRLVVRHRDLIENPVLAVEVLYAQLDALGVRRLTLPSGAEITSFVNGELYREREGAPGLQSFARVPQLSLFERWSTGKSLAKDGHGLGARERKVLLSYESSLPPFVVPGTAPPKKPVEVELREKLAAGEKETHGLKEQVKQLQALLEQRDKHSAFVEEEFTQLRTSLADRESSSSGLLSSLQKMLVERDAWLRDKDRSGEAERGRMMSEIGELRATLSAREEASSALVSGLQETLRERDSLLQEIDSRADLDRARFSEVISDLSRRLEAAVAAAATSDMRLEEALRRAASSEQDLQALAEKLEQLQKSCNGKDDEITNLKAALAKAGEARSVAANRQRLLESKVKERFKEIEIVTKLLIEKERENQRLVGECAALTARLEDERKKSALLTTRSNEALKKFERDMATRDAGIRDLKQLNGILGADLASALAENRRLAVSLAGAAEAMRLDKASLQGLLASSSWKATAPLRRLKTLFSGSAGSPPVIFGADISMVRESEWFDAGWYVDRYGDVASSGLDPAGHYLAYGADEGRDPGPKFSTSGYLTCNPDVAATRMNPLVHYLSYGIGEGRLLQRPERE